MRQSVVAGVFAQLGIACVIAMEKPASDWSVLRRLSMALLL
jgi:hypothetical protein